MTEDTPHLPGVYVREEGGRRRYDRAEAIAAAGTWTDEHCRLVYGTLGFALDHFNGGAQDLDDWMKGHSSIIFALGERRPDMFESLRRRVEAMRARLHKLTA